MAGKRVFIRGGGASLAAHQAGALETLDEQGIRPAYLPEVAREAGRETRAGLQNALARSCIVGVAPAWRLFETGSRHELA